MNRPTAAEAAMPLCVASYLLGAASSIHNGWGQLIVELAGVASMCLGVVLVRGREVKKAEGTR